MILQQTIYIHNSSVELKSEYSCVVDQIRESLWKIKKIGQVICQIVP